MHQEIQGVRRAALCLDGALYNFSPQMAQALDSGIVLRIMEKFPEFKDFDKALEVFREMTRTYRGRANVLEALGFSRPLQVLDEVAGHAETLDFLINNPSLARTLRKISEEVCPLDLISSGPEVLSIEKLKRLTINPALFSTRVYGDNPGGLSKFDGSVFRYLLAQAESQTPGIKPQEYVFVGRCPYVPFASKEGMKTIAVWGSRVGADVNLSNINELEEIFLN